MTVKFRQLRHGEEKNWRLASSVNSNNNNKKTFKGHDFSPNLQTKIMTTEQNHDKGQKSCKQQQQKQR